MATSSMNKFNKISQIWKTKCLTRQSIQSYDDSSSDNDEPEGSVRRIPSGSLAVYVGPERRRFVIPTRFLNLPAFLSLLDQAEEEFGYQPTGGLVFPCEVGVFREILKLVERDEKRFGGESLDGLLKMVSEMRLDSFDHSCKETVAPLLQKARV